MKIFKFSFSNFQLQNEHRKTQVFDLCESAGFFLQGSAKIVALNLEDPYRSARSLQKCADFLKDFFLSSVKKTFLSEKDVTN